MIQVLTRKRMHPTGVLHRKAGRASPGGLPGVSAARIACSAAAVGTEQGHAACMPCGCMGVVQCGETSVTVLIPLFLFPLTITTP